MFCHNCGNVLDDGAKFCPNCGTPIIALGEEILEETVTEPVEEATSVYEEPEAPVYEQPAAPVYEQPVYAAPTVENAETNGLGKACLIFGIIGLAFSCSFYLSLLGIIFSAVGRGKVKAFLAAGGQLTGKAKVGSILSKVGLILGIVLFVFFVIWLIVVIAAAANGAYTSSYRFY